MQWHDNPAIDRAIDNLNEVLLLEAEAGRCPTSAWRLLRLEGRSVRTAGSGCECPECRALIGEMALLFTECGDCAYTKPKRPETPST